MTDVTAFQGGKLPTAAEVAAQLAAFVRTRRGTFAVRIGLAGLASAAAAVALCMALPGRSIAPAPDLRAERPAPAADFDVAQTWHHENALIFAATDPGIRTAQANAWMPAGGMSTLLAKQFPSASHVRLADADEEPDVPLPMPAPASRATAAGAPPAVALGKPVQIEPQVASLPPQQEEQPSSGSFNFLRRLFADPDEAAKKVLASNPKTALYDIVKRVVYLPDGEKLEAHSGYGKFMDDPASVAHKNYGVTPPNVYAVSFREKLFHGVRALRMKPVGSGNMYGRDGILAHSFLLGEEGASNGCISLRDYDKFLQAYEDGKFTQVIVLRSADEPQPAQVAGGAPGGA
jgi:hypothetical protein